MIVGGKQRRQGGNLVGLLSLLFALCCLCMITYGGGGSFKSLLSSGIPEEFYTVGWLVREQQKKVEEGDATLENDVYDV